MAIIFASVPTIRIVRGTTWQDELTLVDKDSGDPVNLVGITNLLMRIRRSIASPILLELSLASGLTLVDDAGGRIGISVSSADTLTLPENGHRKTKYGYDMVIERTAGNYEPAVSGKLSVLPQFTRPWGTT